MSNTPPDVMAFYYLTDPVTAERILAAGFSGDEALNPGKRICITDCAPVGDGGAVLQIAVLAETAATIIECDGSSVSAGVRTFAVPLELLRRATITSMKEA